MTAGAVSIDLDDLWAYRASFGMDEADAPSLWPVALPRFLALMDEAGLRGTAFAVGRDAQRHAPWLRELGAAGHEIGNHSFDHAGDFAAWPEARLETDVQRAHVAIAEAAGIAPLGFRAPSFQLTPALLRVLHRIGYRYDSSAFHNRIAGLAQRWHARRGGAPGGHGQAASGGLRPHRWQLPGGSLLELPVTSLPLLHLPIHGTYLMHLAGHSQAAARAYAGAAAWTCRRSRTPLHWLLHATDFIGADDGLPVAFLPGMRLRWSDKQALLRQLLRLLREHFAPLTLAQWADQPGPLGEPRVSA